MKKSKLGIIVIIGIIILVIIGIVGINMFMSAVEESDEMFVTNPEDLRI